MRLHPLLVRIRLKTGRRAVRTSSVGDPSVSRGGVAVYRNGLGPSRGARTLAASGSLSSPLAERCGGEVSVRPGNRRRATEIIEDLAGPTVAWQARMFRRLALIGLLAALAVGCGKKKTDPSTKESSAQGAGASLVEVFERGSVAWNVDASGQVLAHIHHNDDGDITKS